MPAGKGPKRKAASRDAREYACGYLCVCAMAPGDSPIIFLPFFVAFVIRIDGGGSFVISAPLF